MVSEASGKLLLGVSSLAAGCIGIFFSIFLWHDAPGAVRFLGPYSRSIAGIGGASSLLSGSSLIREVGVSMRARRTLGGVNYGLILLIASLSILSVVLAIVSYLATVSINFV